MRYDAPQLKAHREVTSHAKRFPEAGYTVFAINHGRARRTGSWVREARPLGAETRTDRVRVLAPLGVPQSNRAAPRPGRVVNDYQLQKTDSASRSTELRLGHRTRVDAGAREERHLGVR